MIQGQSIRVQFSARDGRALPISNILLLVQFSRGGNYCYEFDIGRTDASGRLTVSYGDVEKRRSANAVEFPKEYSTKLEDCDPTVKIIVPSEKDLVARMRKVNEDYGSPPEWAASWPSNARTKAQEKTVELTEKTVEVHLSAI